jgi:hypothetical protein
MDQVRENPLREDLKRAFLPGVTVIILIMASAGIWFFISALPDPGIAGEIHSPHHNSPYETSRAGRNPGPGNQIRSNIN